MCLIHSYSIVSDTGLNSYKVCSKCNDRVIVKKHSSGYQPMDINWIETGYFNDNKINNPPRVK